jgi:hypothetical protein
VAWDLSVEQQLLFLGFRRQSRPWRRRPTPNANTQDSTDEGDPRKSFSFSGIQNVSRAGVPVPVVYGETLVGSVVISAGIDIVQVSS